MPRNALEVVVIVAGGTLVVGVLSALNMKARALLWELLGHRVRPQPPRLP